MPKRIKVSNEESQVRAAFRPSTVNEDDRTIEIIFTTGQAGKRYDWRSNSEYVEELEVSDEAIMKDRLDKGLSVMDSHRVYNGIEGVFAITGEYRIENGLLIGVARFATDKKSDRIWTKVKEGILKHVSLGYTVYEYTPAGRSEDDLPVYKATRWQPTELSFVPVSFETTNGVRSRNNDSVNFFEIKVREAIQMTLEQLRAELAAAKTRGADDAEINDLQAKIAAAEAAENRAAGDNGGAAPQIPTPPVASAARTQEQPAAPATPAVDENAVRAETRGTLQPMIDACRAAGLNDDFAIRHYTTGIGVDRFRELVIEELGNESSENVIRTAGGLALNEDDRSDKLEQTRQFATDALMYRCGADVEMNDNIRQFTGLTLHEMSREFLIESGVSVRGMSRQKIAERAFHSTSDFPLILENVMNKNLQKAYVETPQTFRDLGHRTTVNDFREKHTYSLGDAPNLLPLGEHGEYKAGTFGEGKERYAIATYARKIGFTRQMLINDDMSALDRVPAMFGQAGSRLESNIVWGLILNYDFFKNAAANILMEDGLPLYHANHGNLLGAGSAFSVNALSELRKLGRKQKTLDGQFMNVTYEELVLPEDLETTAEKTLVQNFTAITSDTTNPFMNKLKFRVEPRLGVVSQTAYYAFSRMLQTFEYAYLAGEENMYTETVRSIDVDGVQINVRKDFGAGLMEHRGSVKATGAA